MRIGAQRKSRPGSLGGGHREAEDRLCEACAESALHLSGVQA